jgi:hypothetical protein
MGIRFFCPKGHKLNVKEFLAGKKAICPYCGLKVLVPTESTRVSSKRHKADAQAQAANHGSPSLSSPGSAPSSSAIDRAPLGSGSSIIIAGAGNIGAGHAPPPQSAEGSGFSESVSDVLTQISGDPPNAYDPSASASNVLAEADDMMVGVETPLVDVSDPLSDTNNFLWYVRPASGGQLGPATNEILRHWLAKGRVQPDAFVWHEGWSDWQLAGNVFPQFASSLSKPNLIGLLADEPAPPAASQTDLEQLMKSSPRRMQTVTKIVLAVLILALVAVFVTVLITSLSG